jgi:hypothetical protein
MTPLRWPSTPSNLSQKPHHSLFEPHCSKSSGKVYRQYLARRSGLESANQDADTKPIGLKPKPNIIAKPADTLLLSLARRDFIIKMIHTFFGIFCAVRDPDSIDDAKAIAWDIVDDFLTLGPAGARSWGSRKYSSKGKNTFFFPLAPWNELASGKQDLTNRTRNEINVGLSKEAPNRDTSMSILYA